MNWQRIIWLAIAFLLGGVAGWRKERARMDGLVAQGVAAQKQTQDAADDAAAQRAKELKDAIGSKSDADLDAIIADWVRPQHAGAPSRQDSGDTGSDSLQGPGSQT